MTQNAFCIFSIIQTKRTFGYVHSSQTQKLFKIAQKAIIVLYFEIEKVKQEELKKKNLPRRKQLAARRKMKTKRLKKKYFGKRVG